MYFKINISIFWWTLCDITAGFPHTAGFIANRVNNGSVITRTRYGYGVRGYGHGVRKPDPRYTRAEPYGGVQMESMNKVKCTQIGN